jgi:hypothetical protein
MNFETHQASKEQNQQVKNNPVLDFILNVADAAKYIWQHYMEWIIDVSWGKLLLACLLTLIIGGILAVHSLANWLVLGSLLLKCFIGKEDQHQATSAPKSTSDVASETMKLDESPREN